MAYAYDGSSGRLCIYHFALETESREGDTVIEKDGINIFVDSDPQPHVAGLARDVIPRTSSQGWIRPGLSSTFQHAGEVSLRQIVRLIATHGRTVMLDQKALLQCHDRHL